MSDSTNSKISSQTSFKDNNDISLLSLIKTLWRDRRFIFKSIGIFFILGIFVAIVSPKEYTARGTYLPTTVDGMNGVGNLSGLASLAGINLASGVGNSEIPPSLYPKIVESIPFKMALLEAPLYFEEVGKMVTYKEYYENYYSPSILVNIKKYTLGLPSVIIKLFKKEAVEEAKSPSQSPILAISALDLGHFRRLSNQVLISYNNKDGIVEVSAAMPDAIAAAQLTKFAEQILQKEVIAFKIKNAKEQLSFTEERYNEKREEFEKIQSELGRFRDRNQNISSAYALNEQNKLEANYNLAFSVYSELAKQMEQAKLQVSKDTPVFSVINPITIPLEKSAPKRPVIIAIFLVLGIIVSILWVLLSDYISKIKHIWLAS